MAKFKVELRKLDSDGRGLGTSSYQVEAICERTAIILATSEAKKRDHKREYAVVKITEK